MTDIKTSSDEIITTKKIKDMTPEEKKDYSKKKRLENKALKAVMSGNLLETGVKSDFKELTDDKINTLIKLKTNESEFLDSTTEVAYVEIQRINNLILSNSRRKEEIFLEKASLEAVLKSREVLKQIEVLEQSIKK